MEYLAVLIAALFHAAWNAFIKQSADKLIVLTYIRFCGLCAGITILLLSSAPMLNGQVTWFLVPAVFVHYLYYFFLIRTYHISDFSFAYPIARGAAPVFVLLLTLVTAGEQLQTNEIAGVIITSVGIILVADLRRLHLSPGFYMALATAVCISLYTFLSGLGVRSSQSFWVYAAWLEIGTGLGVLGFTGYSRGLNSLITKFESKFMLIGVISVAAYVIALWAMSRINIATVAVLRETSILFAAIIGAFYLKENFGTRRMLASVAITLGVVVLSLP